MRRLRVFVSSTYVDLVDYRQAVTQAVDGLDLQADDMVRWSADARDTATYSVDRVREADVLILLVAHRYGSIPDGEELSIPELEYRAAREAGIPVLAFFVDESIPWPPQHIEWGAREQLAAFRARVRQEVTGKYVRNPQELAVQVTQALANLVARQPARRASDWCYPGAARPVTTPSRLQAEPDVLLPIGTAADGLPMLLEVKRSSNISARFAQLDSLAADLAPSDIRPYQDMVAAFQKSISDFMVGSWRRRGMREVLMTDGSWQELYVSTTTLSGLFHSTLSGLLARAAGSRRLGTVNIGRRGEALVLPDSVPTPALEGTVPRRALMRRDMAAVLDWMASRDEMSADPSAVAKLQSTGGRNRFLGINPQTGTIHSVGSSNGIWVEWRPFVSEHIATSLPGTRLAVLPNLMEVPVAEAARLLMIEALGRVRSTGEIDCQTEISVARQELMTLVVAVADELAVRHAEGKVHGDVKPDNVLLTESGVSLIDPFDVETGRLAPGWTPNWSAPEQVRGATVSPASDVYPLAIMVARILGGEVVGEVRKYRTPWDSPSLREIDLFHSPSLFIDPDHSYVEPRGVGPWQRFVERSLSFDPEGRPASAAEFAGELRELVARHPVEGRLHTAPTGDLVAARLADSADVVCRLVRDQRF